MSLTVSTEARLKGTILELITPNYCGDPNMKWCGFESGGDSRHRKERLFVSCADWNTPPCHMLTSVLPLRSHSTLAHLWFSMIALGSNALCCLTESELQEPSVTDLYSQQLVQGVTQNCYSVKATSMKKGVNEYAANLWWCDLSLSLQSWNVAVSVHVET